MQREGEIYTFDVFPKQISPNNIELWPYPSDSSHFIRPKVLSTSLIGEALTNVQTEADEYIPPAPTDTDQALLESQDVHDNTDSENSNQGGNY